MAVKERMHEDKNRRTGMVYAEAKIFLNVMFIGPCIILIVK